MTTNNPNDRPPREQSYYLLIKVNHAVSNSNMYFKDAMNVSAA